MATITVKVFVCDSCDTEDQAGTDFESWMLGPTGEERQLDICPKCVKQPWALDDWRRVVAKVAAEAAPPKRGRKKTA